MASARERLEAARQIGATVGRQIEQAQRAVDYDLSDFKLKGEGVKRRFPVEESLTSAELELTIEGASTVTLTIPDPDMRLLRSSILTDWTWGRADHTDDEASWVRTGNEVDAELDGIPFRLVRLSKSERTLTLTFEERAVALLRQHKGAKKVSSAKITLGRWVKLLADEVKRYGGIETRIPAIDEDLRRPITRSRERKRDDERYASAGKGMDEGARLTVKGATATREQIRNAERGLDVADSLGAPTVAQLALVMAYIGESTIKNLPGGDGTSVGILQLIDSHLGGSTSTDGGRRDIELVTEMFLRRGFSGNGGAIALSRRESDPAVIAALVQGNRDGASTYAPWRQEAERFLRAYHGGSLDAVDHSAGGSRRTVTRPYEFNRGRDESSWDAIGRVCGEVGWRRFMRMGRLWVISEEDLFAQKPRFRIREAENGVDWIDFDLDLGDRVTEVRVRARAGRWKARPGDVVIVDGQGPANGRYLLVSLRRSLVDPSGACEITLRKPIPERPLPQGQTVTRGGSGGREYVADGSLRERIIQVAEQTLSTRTGHSYYSQQGATTDDPTAPPPLRSDCSQWVRAVYLKAGAPDPGTWTGDQFNRGRQTSTPKPGDLVMDGPAGQRHVELYIGNGRTIGHGSKPIDHWSVDGMRDYYGQVVFITFDFLD